MNKRHAVVIAAVLGLAAVFGLFAAVRTAHLGQASQGTTEAQLAAEQQRLSAAERSLRRQLAQKSGTAPAARAPKSVYVRPAPIIVHLHRDDGEREREGEFDD